MINLMKRERCVLSRLLPSLDSELQSIPFGEIEKPGNPALALFRAARGPALIVPREYGGLGATPREAVCVQRAIGTRSPSLAIATTMHHFSVATLLELGIRDGYEDNILKEVATKNLYIASGFAEGQTTNSCVLDARIKIRHVEGGVVINGSKKPCSLSSSMDYLAVGVLLPLDDSNDCELGVLTIPKSLPGICVRRFWGTWVLGGAESDEVVLDNVFVPHEYISHLGDPKHLGRVQARCLAWFEILIASSYLGAATALVERTIKAGKGCPADRALLATEIEAAMVTLEHIADNLVTDTSGDEEIARIIFVRHAVQGAIERATKMALDLLGGMAFISNSEVAGFFTASHALAFHPPSRCSVAETLDRYLQGGPIVRVNW